MTRLPPKGATAMSNPTPPAKTHVSRRLSPALTLAAALFALCPAAVAAEADGPVRFDQLAAPWNVLSQTTLDATQAAAIGQRFNAEITRITNNFLAWKGQRQQVNVVHCAASSDADQIYTAFLKLHAHSVDQVHRLNDTVIVEFVGGTLATRQRAALALDLPRQAITYRVSFKLVPIEKADYMSANRLSQLLNVASANDETNNEIAKLRQRFQFNREITLRKRGLSDQLSRFELNPTAGRSQLLARGDIVRYGVVGELPRQHDIPTVSVTATIHCRDDARIEAKQQPAENLLRPTRHWPANDPRITERVAKITANCDSPAARLDALLQWCAGQTELKYGGPIVGSRYGVPVTLKQGFGRCWDFADVFVTLCRAADIPCRQVAGWLGTAGHVWAEVLIDNHWRQVDPTTGMECTAVYIPMFTTENGEMPIVYAAWPTIDIISHN